MDDRELAAELTQLQAMERLVSARRRRLHERIAIFPDANGELQRQEREVSAERRRLHGRIDALRALRSARRYEQPAA